MAITRRASRMRLSAFALLLCLTVGVCGADEGSQGTSVLDLIAPEPATLAFGDEYKEMTLQPSVKYLLSTTGAKNAIQDPIGFVAKLHLLFHQRSVAFKSTRRFTIYSYHNLSDISDHLSDPNDTTGLKLVAEDVKSYTLHTSPYSSQQLLLQITSSTDVDLEIYQRSVFKLPLVAIFAAGLALILLAHPLSQNLLFYYSAGTLLGTVLIIALLLVMVGREVNRRVSTFMAIFLGTTSSLLAATGIQMADVPSTVELVNMLWAVAMFQSENIYFSYGLYAILLVCFLTTYWFGPPSPRTQDTIAIVFYLLGGGMVVMALQERYLAVAVAILAVALASFIHSAFGQTVVALLSPSTARTQSSAPTTDRQVQYDRRHLDTSLDHAPPPYAATPTNNRRRRLDTLRDEFLQSPARVQSATAARLGNPERLYQFVDGETDVDNTEYQQIQHALTAAQLEDKEYHAKLEAQAQGQAHGGGGGLFSDDDIDDDDEVVQPQPVKFTHVQRRQPKRVVKEVEHGSAAARALTASTSFLGALFSPSRARKEDPAPEPVPETEADQPLRRRMVTTTTTTRRKMDPPVLPSAPTESQVYEDDDDADVSYTARQARQPEPAPLSNGHGGESTHVRRTVRRTRQVEASPPQTEQPVRKTVIKRAVVKTKPTAARWTLADLKQLSNADLRNVAKDKLKYTGAVTSASRVFIERKLDGMFR